MEPMKAGKQREGQGAVVPAACFWRIMSAAASFALANSVPLMLFLDFCSRASTSVSVCSTSIVHAQGDTYGGRRGVEGKGGAGAGGGKGGSIGCRARATRRATYNRGRGLLGLGTSLVTLVAAGHDVCGLGDASSEARERFVGGAWFGDERVCDLLVRGDGR